MMHNQPSSPDNQLSIRKMAGLAGVSTATVSRALSGKAGVAKRTRQKIERIAREKGYAPNVVLAAAAAKRFRAASGKNIALAFLVRPPDRLVPRALANNAKSLAGLLAPRNYDLQLINTWEHEDPVKLSRLLYNCGVQGVFLKRVFGLDDYIQRMDLRHFAVVSFDEEDAHPHFHMVRQSTFKPFLHLHQLARERGYRRIGAVLYDHPERNTPDDIRVKAAETFCRNQLPPEEQVLPLYTTVQTEMRIIGQQIAAWRAREKPDAVIARSLLVTEAMHDRSGLGLAVLTSGADDDYTGFHTVNNKVGRHGAMLMETLLRAGELGTREDPMELIVQPDWNEGNTLPPRGSPAAACQALESLPRVNV